MGLILNAFLVLGTMGGLSGLVLAVASRVFHVEPDPREEAGLPGANCGRRGFPGCTGAVTAGEAPVNACAAGGAQTATRPASIPGAEDGDSRRWVALVKCTSYNGLARRRFDYVGLQDCHAAALLLDGGPNACAYGCLGFGSCVKACPYGAISVKNGVAVVDRERCVGCMKCADACPKQIIVKVPYHIGTVVACSSREKGAVLRQYCDNGCIGCGICQRTCKHDAIHVTDHLARIDYSKCIACGQCILKCPRRLIWGGRISVEV